MITFSIFFFVLGSIIGSFLNVVILRYGSGRGFVRGRSSCPHCRHELGTLELVPIFGFLYLGGRCRHCRSKISWQYPLIELLTALLFVGAFIRQPNFSLLFIDLIIFSLLVIIFAYDWKHKIIPDGPVYLFIIFSLLKILLIYPNIPDLFSGPILFLPFYLIWLISRGRWMGFGDAKLAIGIGWFLGLLGGISAIILAFWIGAGVGILLLLLQALSSKLIKSRKKLTIKSEIPFAPFLILGLWLVYFFSLDPAGLHLLLSH